jgi:hypothetical protein
VDQISGKSAAAELRPAKPPGRGILIIVTVLLSGWALYIVLPYVAIYFAGNAFRVQDQRAWIQNAVAELAHVPPPPTSQNPATTCWIAPGFQTVTNRNAFPPSKTGYLLFSNGWAAYKIHTSHQRGRIDDTAVLRDSEGNLYVGRRHLCGGITEWMAPNPLLGFFGLEIQPDRPVDMENFLATYGRLQGWTLFGGEGRPWCVISCPEGAMRFREGKEKSLWLWVSEGSGTNRTTLFDRRYSIAGHYVCGTPHWLSNDCLTVDVYDYGPDRARKYNPDDRLSNHITSMILTRDKPTGKFMERANEQ